MAELTLTSWMDPIFDYFAKESGIPVADYSAMAGGEAIGASIEVISDLTLQPLATKIIGALIGAASVSFGVWGKPSMRLRKELVALGHHMLTRILDPTPSDIIGLRRNINDLLRGLRLGNMSIVTSALLRSPAELGQMLKALGVPVQNVTPPLAPRLIPRIPAIPGIPAVSPRLAGFPFPSPITPPESAFAPPQYTLDGVPLGKRAPILSPKYMLSS